MYGNPPVFHASVPPTKDIASRQLVVRARGSYWARWYSHNDLATAYDPLARDALVNAWWIHVDDWYRVYDQPCERCRHYYPRCVVCLDAARYFIDTDQAPVAVELCDRCGPALEDEARWEIGFCACCDGCLCDSWK